MLQGGIAEANRFHDEAQALASFKHPHVVELLDFGIHEGQHFMALEYLTGGTLHPLGGQVDSARATVLGAQLLEALRAGHRGGVLHRDVKPANVMLAADGTAKLTDYGLAQFLGRTGRTATGLIVGTPEFMAPELFQGSKASPASDIYAWGCTYYHLLVGCPPITGTLAEVVTAATSGTWRPTGQRGPVAQALAAALEADPARRADAKALLDMLAGPETVKEFAHRAAAPRLAPTARTTRLVGTALPRQPPASAARRRAPPLAVVAVVLGCVLLGAWLQAERVPAVPVSPSPAVPGLDSLRLAWRERLETIRPPRWVSRVHEELAGIVPDLSKDNYCDVMWNHAHGRQHPGVDEVLARARADLQFQAEMKSDRPALAAVLSDTSVPFSERWSLYETLRKLEHADAYLVAWGAEPAYHVTSLLAGLVQVEARDLQAVPRMQSAPDPPPAGPPPPGSYRMHRWPASWSSAKYVIVPNPENGNQTERLAWLAAGMVPEEHAMAFGEIDLGPRPAEDFARVEIEATIANLVFPNLLRLRWNQYEFQYRTPRERLTDGSWSFGDFPDHRVVLELPKGALRPGRNTLKITTRPTPGLRHSVGPNLDLVGVTVSSAASPDGHQKLPSPSRLPER